MKPTRALVLVTAVLAAASLGANRCAGPPTVAFLAPTNGQVVTWMPVTIELRLRADVDPATLVATLNGNDISAAFVLTPEASGSTLARAERVWAPGYVVTGAGNTLAVDVASTQGTAFPTSVIAFEASGDPYADAVASFTAGSGAGFGTTAEVLGPPTGAGLFGQSLDVLSLGLGGSIELEFVDNVVVDGPGVDLNVFENAFLVVNSSTLLVERPFSEPARVSVSQDGVSWFAFPCALDLSASPLYPGCAGVFPVLADAGDPAAPHASLPTSTPIEDLVGVSALALPPVDGAGGDRFDLADVGLAWARFVRIEAASFVDGPVGADNAGFDLDAVAAVNAAPATDADGNGIPDAVE